MCHSGLWIAASTTTTKFLLENQAFNIGTSKSDVSIHSATSNFWWFLQALVLGIILPKKNSNSTWILKFPRGCFPLGFSCCTPVKTIGRDGEFARSRRVWRSNFGEGSSVVAYICTTNSGRSGPKQQPSLKVLGSYYQGNGGGWSLWDGCHLGWDVMVGLSCWLTCPIFEHFRNCWNIFCSKLFHILSWVGKLGGLALLHGNLCFWARVNVFVTLVGFFGLWLFGRCWWFTGIIFRKYWLLDYRLAYTIGHATNWFWVKMFRPLFFFEDFQWKILVKKFPPHVTVDVRHHAERTWCNRSMHIFVVTWLVSGNKDLEMMPMMPFLGFSWNFYLFRFSSHKTL